MKRILTYFFILLALPAFSQVNFTSIQTWEEAAKKAEKEKKLIFIQFQDSKCQECNEVATRGLSSALLKEKFETNFVSLKCDIETEEGKKLASKFDIKHGPVSLFADANGNILNRFLGSTDASFKYAEEADIAIKRRTGKKLSDYDKEYAAGARSAKFLEEYLAKRAEVKLPVADLLEQYVGILPVDSLSSYRVVKFIHTMGPTLDSKAYMVLQTPVSMPLIDSIYKVSPLKERVAINNAIIQNSFQKAVAKKDNALAERIGSFIIVTHKENFQKGWIARGRNMTRYYYFVKDTARYMREAVNLLEQNHMQLTADSLMKMDEKDAKAQKPMKGNPASGQTQTFSFAPESQFYHMDLNEHAWHVYEMSSKTMDLERALKWSYQSQELFNGLNRESGHPMRLGNPAYIDTYAQILYKLGRKDEAILWQTKAVEAQNVTGNSSQSLQETLQKMKLGTL